MYSGLVMLTRVISAYTVVALHRVCVTATLHLSRDGDGEVEGSAMRRAGRHPQLSVMCFDDRSADRKSHAEAVGFVRKEGVEDSLRDVRIEPRAGVLDRNPNTVRL